jgi:hypothetical protein
MPIGTGWSGPQTGWTLADQVPIQFPESAAWSGETNIATPAIAAAKPTQDLVEFGRPLPRNNHVSMYSSLTVIAAPFFGGALQQSAPPARHTQS